jgi:hypothetical protein
MEDQESLERGAYCGKCGQPLKEATSLPCEQRQPCFVCGSLRRHRFVDSQGEVPAGYSTLDLKARHGQPGAVKPHLEVKIGDTYDRDTGRCLKMEQVVDRENNRYRKRLADKETGAVIRDDSGGPLDQHQPRTWRKP